VHHTLRGKPRSMEEGRREESIGLRRISCRSNPPLGIGTINATCRKLNQTSQERDSSPCPSSFEENRRRNQRREEEEDTRRRRREVPRDTPPFNNAQERGEERGKSPASLGRRSSLGPSPSPRRRKGLQGPAASSFSQTSLMQRGRPPVQL